MSDAVAAPAPTTVAAAPANSADTGAAPASEEIAKTGTLRERADAAKAKEAAPTVDKLARAQAALEKTRAQAAAHRRAQAAVQKSTAEAATLRQELAAAKASEAKLQQLAKLVDEDPYAAMHAMGITPDGLGKHGTPEAAIAKMQAKFQADLEAERAERTKLEEQIRNEKTQANVEQAKKHLLSLVTTGDYPNLQTWTDRVIVREVNDLLVAIHGRTDEWYPFEDALSHLESEAAQKKAALAPQKTPATTTAARAGADGKKPQSPAINNQAAARSAGPGNAGTLTQAQRKERIVSMIRERRVAREGAH